MEDTSMYQRNLLLAVCLLALCIPAGAVINVTPISIGSTYIIWEWNAGLDLQDMFVDGNVMCGYETTDNQFAITGLNPSELHTIYVNTTTDYGTNITSTLSGNVTSTGGGDSGDSLAPGVALGIVGGIIIMAKKGMGL